MTVRPKVRTDLVLVEQTYRGEQSYIIKDPESRKYFRFRPVEILVMQALDGHHTAAEAAAALTQEGVKVAPAGVASFAQKLSTMGLCERTLSERSVLLMERLRAERQRRLRPQFLKGDLMRLRWSVGDPDQLFDRWLPRVRFFFSRTFLTLSVALFGVYFLVLGLKWPEFVHALVNLYTLNWDLSTIVILWITGTIIIVIHELGHGFTCKYFGGQVHEIGAMLIYFQTAFYCNVNDAWTFPERRARIWVTAAGSWIQLVVASLAAMVWWAATPGTLVYEVALAAVLVGGITTVLMNLNPLIPLDGYYALSDYLEVPNLRQRAFSYLGWLCKTRVLRMKIPTPPADPREQRIFVIYAVLASIYIVLILSVFAAASYVGLQRWFGALGIGFLLTGVVITLYQPVRTWYGTLRAAGREHAAYWSDNRRRRNLVLGGIAVLLTGALVPCPVTVGGRFRVVPTISLPHMAPDSGVIVRVEGREGTQVSPGTPLLQIRNLELERELLVSQRVSDSLAVRVTQARARGRPADAAVIEAEQRVELARLSGLRQRTEALHIRALHGGVVVTRKPEELAGRWVSVGEEVLRLGNSDSIEIRIALAGAGRTLVRVGDPVRLLSDGSLSPPVKARVAAVSLAASSPDLHEVRLSLKAGSSWRPGMTGRAKITLRQTNLWGALWWGVRRTVRSDILL
jgi:hypothetical protein